MKQPHLDIDTNREWRNWHETRGVGGTVQRLYTPTNFWADGTSPTTKRFQAGLAGLQRIVLEAEAGTKRVRAVGGGWSLSPVAFTDEFLVNTTRLSYWFVGFKDTMVEAAWQPKMARLVFAQCGVSIKTLNAHLEAQRLALPTSGASNGQTIVGAMSTGTHGSANQVGSIPDYILGLHVVAEGGKHYWIERDSRRVVTKTFTDWLGAERLRDDELFKAAVVGFGSFGLVHAVLFAAEPIYALDRFVKQCDAALVKKAIASLDLTGLGLPGGTALPFHFSLTLNPYRLKTNEKGAFVSAYYRRQIAAAEALPTVSTGASLNSPDLIGIASLFSDAIPNAIPGILQGEIQKAAADTKGKKVPGTPGQQFGDTGASAGGGTSFEIGLPADRAGDAVNLVLSVTGNFPFGAPIALRWVKGSDALLAFTRFTPISCTLEMPGIDSIRSRQAHERIFAAFAASTIPHTYHWGQALPMHPHWVRAGFGSARVDRWLAARRNFLGATGRHMFANALVERCGLAEV